MFLCRREAWARLSFRFSPLGTQEMIYSSTFIFAKKQFDDEFHRLDQEIAAAARTAQANWLTGYRVVIAQVMRAYGGGNVDDGVVMFDAP